MSNPLYTSYQTHDPLTTSMLQTIFSTSHQIPCKNQFHQSIELHRQSLMNFMFPECILQAPQSILLASIASNRSKSKIWVMFNYYPCLPSYYQHVDYGSLTSFPANFNSTNSTASMHIIYLPNPSAWAGDDTRSIFKRSLTGLNSEFFLLLD